MFDPTSFTQMPIKIVYAFPALLLLLAGLSCAAESTGEVIPDAILAKCDRYLAELLRQPDESALVDELCERIQSLHDTCDPSVLRKIPAAQKLLWDACSSKSVLDNGGIEYYLTADFVDYAGRAQSFRGLGLVECADLLEQAYAAFPNAKVPDRIEDRKKLMKQMPAETRDHWNHLSDKYFERAGQLSLLLGDHVRKHAEAFVVLRKDVDDAKYIALCQKNVSPPASDASPREVINWLKMIGGGSHDRSTERLNSVWLGANRRSTSQELRCLSGMNVARDIEELGLDDTKLRDADAKYLLKFPRLRVLHLRNASISEPTVDVIEHIPSLRVLWITGTKISYERFRLLVGRKEFDEILYCR